METPLAISTSRQDHQDPHRNGIAATTDEGRVQVQHGVCAEKVQERVEKEEKRTVRAESAGCRVQGGCPRRSFVVAGMLSISVERLMTAIARPELLPIRVLAGVALATVIAAFIYVIRHLKQIERRIVADDLVPEQLGARNNVVLIICAIPVIVVTLLLFLVIKA